MIPSMPVYTDFAQLSELKNKARQNDAENITNVARQFESLFTQMVIKSMRQASLGNDLMGNNGGEMYRDMFDKQIALSLSQGKGLGLADAMIRQMKQPGSADAAETTQIKQPELSHTIARPTPVAIPLNPEAANAPEPTARALPANIEKAAEPSLQLPVTRNVPGRTPGLSLHRPAAEPNPEAVSATQRQAALKAYGAIQAPAVEVAMRNPIHDRGLNSEAIEAPAPLPSEVLRLDQAQKHRNGKDTPESFIANVWPAAQRVADDLGVSPRVLIAQAALETGWGRALPKHADGTSGNNYFGIKTHGKWQGQQIAANTTEIVNGQEKQEVASFRAYDSVEASFRDFANFLKTNPRYQQALEVTHDANKFVEALQKAGYATDPNYADKIKSIMNGRRMNTMVAQVNTGNATGQVV